MALIPALFGSMLLLTLFFVVYGIVLLIGKGGMTLLASKMHFKNYGLLWIPFVGSWFDGQMVGKFMGSKDSKWSFFYVAARVIPFLFYIGLVIYINSPEFTPSPTESLSNMIMLGMLLAAFLAEVLYRVSKMIAMLKGEANAVLATFVGLFFPDFWAYFMLNKVK